MDEWVWSNDGMILTGETTIWRKKTCPTSTMCTTNPTSSAMVSASDFRGQGTASDRLSLRTARKGNFAYLFLSH